MHHTLRQSELNHGTAQTNNLMESLSIDFNILIPSTLNLKIPFVINNSLGITKRMLITSQWLYNQEGFDLFQILKSNPSDTIRGLGCYLVALTSKSFAEKIQLILPLANDPHYGVREWAWLALRKDVAKNPVQAIEILQPFTKSPHENIRRFVSELTRPRGVWCSHIIELKEKPWLGLSLIENLHNDESRYVQLSVGNWLNDAGKNHKEWVQDLCSRWLVISPTKNTQTICKRALRNITV